MVDRDRQMSLEIRIQSYWHSGSGRGEGPGADAVVVRDPHDLPYLPGRHIKGLLRHAMQFLEDQRHVDPGTTARIFGWDGQGEKDGGRYATQPGRIRIGRGQLPEAWRRYAATDEAAAALPNLYCELSSTALEDGVARTGSLRTLEVVVPLTLTAAVEGDIDQDDVQALKRAAALVRAVGANRTRGLGRARLVLVQGDRP